MTKKYSQVPNKPNEVVSNPVFCYPDKIILYSTGWVGFTVIRAHYVPITGCYFRCPIDRLEYLLRDHEHRYALHEALA